MKLLKVLQEVGLNENEAKVYLALLELGEGNVAEVSIKAKVKRPTAYLILQILENKRLVKMNSLHKTAVYNPENPNCLLNQLESNKNLVESILPKMMASYKMRKD